MSGLLLLALSGCGPAELMDPMSPPQVEARASLSDKAVDPGEPVTLTLTVVTSEGWVGFLEPPEVAGLSFELADESSSRDTSGGTERAVVRRAYDIIGEPGSYIIPSVVVAFSGPNDQRRELATSTLFLDLGVEGPSSQLSELVMAPVPEPARWPYAVGALAAGVLLGVVIVFLLNKRGAGAAAAPLRPHEILLGAWAAVKADPSLDDEARATSLSALFRTYLEAITGVEATALTTGELTQAFRAHGGLEDIEDDCLLILLATDQVKYAGEGGGAEVFVELDQALDRVVQRELQRELEQLAAAQEVA